MNMGLKLYDTLRGKKLPFRPIDEKNVRMFVCGPTVYDSTHIGHAKTYITSDIIARWIRHGGYTLKLLVNITDVDDKIIKRASDENTTSIEIARRYEAQFKRCMERIGITSVDIYERAHDHIAEIQSQIVRLLENGSAYITETGIYYDITGFKDYGKLSRQNPEELNRHRVEPDTTKRNPHDFSVWKRAPARSDPSWEFSANIKMGAGASPERILGQGADGVAKLTDGSIKLSMNGRPGWHIEDTAIAEKYLGVQYDIHGGGLDLIFPHHECEIAQMESVSGKRPMVNYWAHTGLLTVNGKKMSKSLKNFTTVDSLLEKYTGETLRMALINAHYRSPVDFSAGLMDQAKAQLERLYNSLELLRSAKESKEGKEIEITSSEALKEFEESMDDDINTPGAIKAMFDLAAEINRSAPSGMSKATKAKAEDAFMKMASALGILTGEARDEKLTDAQLSLVAERETARKSGDYKEADRIRKELASQGVTVDDTKEGPKARRS